jgi:hypothetical protein
VTEIDPGGAMTVASPRRGSVVLPAEYVARHVELGWAVTGYGNQGDTADIGIAVLEPGTSRNLAYVALTRGRGGNDAWIPDPTGCLDPEAQLAGIIGKGSERSSALAQRDRLHDSAGRAPVGLGSSFEQPRHHRPHRYDTRTEVPDRLQHRPAQPPDRSLGL